ncbi:early nodulin-like protein 1 precursor [Zea mays]|uniref:Early nodulin-like protein 1 n=1 Tax=Zea mays TaxID=4577 RepID=A0A1D6MQH2_MAIZE|nr:early nodulin-like protein 1 precursor [Zea mays]ONM31262.1 Early nodulin-like protein 1 [Zea mays]
MAASNSSALLPVLALAGVVFLLVAPAVVAEAAAPQGLEFHVGGPRGWRVPDANTSYGWWTMKNRFRVGDHLYFKYTNDSVLLVDRTAFDACNTTEPLATFDDGGTKFVLDRPGFFCFISGEPGHCEEGQRLIVRVMVQPAIVATPGPASGPATSAQPDHGGGHSSGAATAVAAAAVAAALAVFASLV